MVTVIRVKAEDGISTWSLIREHADRKIDEYDLLIEAVVRQAARDLKSIDYEKRTDAMDFFRSEWFNDLTDGLLDGEEIIQELLRKE